MAGYASEAEVSEKAEGVMRLQIENRISGTKFPCNIACNASGGQLASQVVQLLSREEAFHLHLSLGDKQLDLEQTMSGNVLVENSVVQFVCKPATPEEVRAIQGKASQGEELAITERMLWQSLPVLDLSCVREPPDLALPTCLQELKLDLSKCTNLRNLGCLSGLALCTKLQKLYLNLQSQEITNINALSCLGQFTSLLELTLYLVDCEGLLDLDPLTSMGRCVNLKKLNLDLRYLKITNINALSCLGQFTSLLELTLDLVDCEGLHDLDPLTSMGRCVNLKKLNLNLARLKITNINAFSCLGQFTSLLELTLYLVDCEGLLDLDPLTSMERCVNMEKLNLNLDEPKIANINALSCLGQFTSLLELSLGLYGCEGLSDLDPLTSMERCVNLKKLNLDLREMKVPIEDLRALRDRLTAKIAPTAAVTIDC